jgi:hypothetical protein
MRKKERGGKRREEEREKRGEHFQKKHGDWDCSLHCEHKHRGEK